MSPIRYLSPTYRLFKDIAFIVAGIFSAALGLKGFLMSSHFIDGGVTGISMLISSLLGWPLSILLVVINLPFIALGYREMGKQFAVRSTIAIFALAVVILVIPFPDVTPDLLLTAIFGGFFIGAGIGLAMRGGAVLDGTEIASLLISRKYPIMKVGDVILVLNVIIFGTAAFFLSIEQALYSMITYFAASKTIEFLLHGIEEYTVLLIVSDHSEQVRSRIMENGWGITVLKGQQGFGKRGRREQDTDVLMVVLTRLQISRLRNVVAEVDNDAFFIQHSVDDVSGGKIKHRPLH